MYSSVSESITLYYRSIGRKMACEVLFFNADRQVMRGVAHYDGPAS